MIDFTKLPWSQIEMELHANGIDTSKISQARRAMVLARLAAEDWPDDLTWSAVADDLAEKHPTWETLARRRRRHAEELMDSRNHRESDSDDVAELVDYRFAAVTNFKGHSGVHVVGDTDADICAFVIAMHDREYSEWLEEIIDLDTGDVYARAQDLQTVIKITFNGHSAEHAV